MQTRLLTKNELIELAMVANRIKMKIKRLAIYQNLEIEDDSHYYKTSLYFINEENNHKITIISKIPLDEKGVLNQLKTLFKLELINGKKTNSIRTI